MIDWPTAMVILGVLGNIALALIKLLPAKHKPDESGITHIDLRTEMKELKIEMHDGFKEMNLRVDKILLKG